MHDELREERAAIIEFDGNLPREQAERLADVERDERRKLLRGLAKLGSDVLGDHPLPGEVLRAAKLAG